MSAKTTKEREKEFGWVLGMGGGGEKERFKNSVGFCFFKK